MLLNTELRASFLRHQLNDSQAACIVVDAELLARLDELADELPDAATMREDGLITFVDRIKDCIRRRAGNISATEIEQVVAALPDISEVAAYAMPAIVPEAGAVFDPAELARRSWRATAPVCATALCSPVGGVVEDGDWEGAAGRSASAGHRWPSTC